MYYANINDEQAGEAVLILVKVEIRIKEINKANSDIEVKVPITKLKESLKGEAKKKNTKEIKQMMINLSELKKYEEIQIRMIPQSTTQDKDIPITGVMTKFDHLTLE